MTKRFKKKYSESPPKKEGFYSGRLGRAIQSYLFSRPSDPTEDILGITHDDTFYESETGNKLTENTEDSKS